MSSFVDFDNVNYFEISRSRSRECCGFSWHPCKIVLTDGRAKEVNLHARDIESLVSRLPVEKVIRGDMEPHYPGYWNPDRMLRNIFADRPVSYFPPIPENPNYPKIGLSHLEKVRNAVCIIFTLGIFLAIQQIRFAKALNGEDLETAKSALRWGAIPYLRKEKIVELEGKEQFKSLEFLASQIQFNPNDPYGGPAAAGEFLSARDDREEKDMSQKLLKILPYDHFPRTYLFGNPYNWGPRDDYYTDVRYFRHFYPSDNGNFRYRVYRG